MRKRIEENTLFYLLAIHLFVVFIRCLSIFYGSIDLHSEEAQYWTWSQHLDWSYYSKPPMVAFLNFLSGSILGHSKFSIRINAIIFGFLINIVTYLFAKELFKDKLKAFIASILVYAMPFFQGVSLFFSTDSPLLFFALWAMHLGWLAITYDRWKHWLLFAVALGLGYLSKYAMLFFIPATFIYLFINKKEILYHKKLYVSLLISFVFFLPVIIWNFKYDFIGLKHIVNLSGVAEVRPYPFGRRMLKLLEYIGGQLAIISPLFLLYYFRAFKKYRFDKKILYLWLPALITFVVFIGVAVKRRSGVNVNWTMFSYVGLPIILAHHIVEARKIKPTAILFCVTISLFLLAVNIRHLDSIGIGKLFPVKADPLVKLVGWKDFAQTVDSLENTLNTDKFFVFTDSYHITSELLFYNYPKTKFYYANRGCRMTQFSLWKNIEQFEQQNYTGIYITKDYLYKKDFTPQSEPNLPEAISSAFDKEYSYHTKLTYYRGKAVAQYHIYILKNFKNLPATTNSY